MSVSGNENNALIGSSSRLNWSEGVNQMTPAFRPYPPNQPFIFDDYRREPNKPVKAFPESSRREILSALRSLQERLQRVELEQSQRYNDELSRPLDSGIQLTSGVRTSEKSQMTEGIHSKLDTAEERCQLLEQQLNSMQNMLQQAEFDRSEVLRKSALLRESHASSTGNTRHQSQPEKIVELEREQLRLKAMQTLAASQIQELEDKLQTERHYRRMMQNKAAELESAATANRILVESDKSVKAKNKKQPTSVRKNKSTRRPHQRRSNSASRKTTPEHYHLNLSEIPFINGKSTGKSHSLSANFQEVLSLMKSHTPRLCRTAHSARSDHRCEDAKTNGCRRDDEDDVEVEPTNNVPNHDLSSLLVQLQDEFGQMSFEHKELLHHIQEATDVKSRDDLERELDCLVSRMETKSDQITRLRQYQETLGKKKRRASKSRASSAQRTSETVSSIRPKSNRTPKKSRPIDSPSKAQDSLHLLKDLKRIQATLRQDDIVWDC